MRCIVCNRVLKSKKAIEQHMGSVCHKRHSKSKKESKQIDLFPRINAPIELSIQINKIYQ